MITDKAKNAPSLLHEALDFTDEDLAENRQYRISPRQHQRLRSADQVVYKYSGPVFIRVYKTRNGFGYELAIQNQTFYIQKQAILIFKNGASYDIYMARDTQTILSAQPIGTNLALIDVKQLYDVLEMQPDDLPANHQGHLSRSQRRRLLIEPVVYFALSLIPLMIMAYLLSIGSATLATWSLTLPLILVGLGPTLITGALLIVPLIEALRGVVRVKEGLPVLEVGQDSRDRLMIKDKTFKVPTRILLAFSPDLVHRVYYIPLTNTIVAAERVEVS